MVDPEEVCLLCSRVWLWGGEMRYASIDGQEELVKNREVGWRWGGVFFKINKDEAFEEVLKKHLQCRQRIVGVGIKGVVISVRVRTALGKTHYMHAL